MTVLTLTNCLHYSHYDQQLTCCCTQKVGQQVQYLIILTKIKYTARLSNILSECRDCNVQTVKQCRSENRYIHSDVWTWANVVLCAGQLPSLPKPFWQKALQPESLPWAIVEACPGWYERYVNSFLHSEDHTLNNTFDVGIYDAQINSKYYVLTSSSMLKWIVWSL